MASLFTWVAVDNHVVVADAASGLFQGLTPQASTDLRSASVKAQLASNPTVNCTANVWVYAGLQPADGKRVIVIDELSGRPIPGAVVAIGGTTVATDALGVASFASLTPGTPETVSVFEPAHDYVTVVNITRDDMLIPIRRNADQAWGGFQGKFTNLPSDASLHIGMAGTSMPGSFVDLSFSQLVGPDSPTIWNLGGQNTCSDIPSGVVVGMGGTAPFKGTFGVVGSAGVCSDEATIEAGLCGTRSAWALMGDIPIFELNLSQIANFTDIGAIPVLVPVLPATSRFDSQVKRDVSFGLANGATENFPACNEPTKSGGWSSTPIPNYPDFTNSAAFPSEDLAPQIPLAFRTFVDVPKLPQVQVNGTPQYLEGAILLGGSIVPSRGVVPLGLTSALGSTDEYRTNGFLIGDSGQNGVIKLHMAPNSGGVEGCEYGVVVMALSTSQLAQNSAASSVSALIAFEDKLTFEGAPDPSVDISFPGGFLPIPQGASYDYRGSTFTPPEPGIAGAAFYRVAFFDNSGLRWLVYFASGTVNVPSPPLGTADRTMAGDDPRTDLKSTQVGSAFALTAFGTTSVGESDVLGHLFDFAPTPGDDTLNASSLVLFTNAFSFHELDYPAVKIISPVNGESVLCSGVSVEVEADNFAVPAQGTIQVQAFQGGMPLGQLQTVSELNSANQGWVYLSGLPSGSVTITAWAADPTGKPIDPPAQASVTITVP
jgi:hypothetical protein